MSTDPNWYCVVCGSFNGPKSGDDCGVCWAQRKHQNPVVYLVPVAERDLLAGALRKLGPIISMAPHAAPCEQGSKLLAGPCSCWKKRARAVLVRAALPEPEEQA